MLLGFLRPMGFRHRGSYRLPRAKAQPLPPFPSHSPRRAPRLLESGSDLWLGRATEQAAGPSTSRSRIGWKHFSRLLAPRSHLPLSFRRCANSWAKTGRVSAPQRLPSQMEKSRAHPEVSWFRRDSDDNPARSSPDARRSCGGQVVFPGSGRNCRQSDGVVLPPSWPGPTRTPALRGAGTGRPGQH
jgi:hypothetical protein